MPALHTTLRPQRKSRTAVAPLSPAEIDRLADHQLASGRPAQAERLSFLAASLRAQVAR